MGSQTQDELYAVLSHFKKIMGKSIKLTNFSGPSGYVQNIEKTKNSDEFIASRLTANLIRSINNKTENNLQGKQEPKTLQELVSAKEVDPRSSLKDEVLAMCDAIIEQSPRSQNETIVESKEFTIKNDANDTFRVSIERLGKTELLARIVEEWLADPNHPTRPPLYKDREKVNGKKQNPREFLEMYYKKYLSARVIYRDQLTKLDPALVKQLPVYFNDGELENIVPTKSTRIDKTLQKLASSGLDKARLLGLGHAAYRR